MPIREGHDHFMPFSPHAPLRAALVSARFASPLEPRSGWTKASLECLSGLLSSTLLTGDCIVPYEQLIPRRT